MNALPLRTIARFEWVGAYDDATFAYFHLKICKFLRIFNLIFVNLAKNT